MTNCQYLKHDEIIKKMSNRHHLKYDESSLFKDIMNRHHLKYDKSSSFKTVESTLFKV